MVASKAEPGSELAAVLPSLIRALQPHSVAVDRSMVDTHGFGEPSVAVLVVVDGLGWSNLATCKANARFLFGQSKRRIETVRPSTTGAALTTLMTGALPGSHGMLGYKIRDPQSGQLRTTLTDWNNVPPDWLGVEPLFLGVSQTLSPVAVGRPSHSASGLTRSILAGAKYVAGESIADRFEVASKLISGGESHLIYLYVDELDRAGHKHGWQSAAWLRELEELDSQLRQFSAGLPKGALCVVTADHGMVDVPHHKQIIVEAQGPLLEGVEAIGGEPRFRYLFTDRAESEVSELAREWKLFLGETANVYTKHELVNAGVLGTVEADLLDRIGEITLISKGTHALYTDAPEDEKPRQMVGQHGALLQDELGIPLITISGG